MERFNSVKSIEKELIRRGPEWVHAFKELADVFITLNPEQKQMVLNFLESKRRSEF